MLKHPCCKKIHIAIYGCTPSSAGIVTQSTQNEVLCHVHPLDQSCAGRARKPELSLTADSGSLAEKDVSSLKPEHF